MAHNCLQLHLSKQTVHTQQYLRRTGQPNKASILPNISHCTGYRGKFQRLVLTFAVLNGFATQTEVYYFNQDHPQSQCFMPQACYFLGKLLTSLCTETQSTCDYLISEGTILINSLISISHFQQRFLYRQVFVCSSDPFQKEGCQHFSLISCNCFQVFAHYIYKFAAAAKPAVSEIFSDCFPHEIIVQHIKAAPGLSEFVFRNEGKIYLSLVKVPR